MENTRITAIWRAFPGGSCQTVGMVKWIDIPPVWLALHLAVVWVLAPLDPFSFVIAGTRPLGTFLLIGGLSLMLMAVWEMRQHRTTPIPHMEPDALVSSGVFAISRNPIYLGDALILGGVILRADSPMLLVLIPIFVLIIQKRFIRAEESRLRRAFGAAFDAYCEKTRRWV